MARSDRATGLSGCPQVVSDHVANIGPELSEGTRLPGGPVCFVPSPSPGWTWPLRFRTLASASSEQALRKVGCILSRSWSLAYRLAEAARRPSIPIRFSVNVSAEAVVVREP